MFFFLRSLWIKPIIEVENKTNFCTQNTLDNERDCYVQSSVYTYKQKKKQPKSRLWRTDDTLKLISSNCCLDWQKGSERRTVLYVWVHWNVKCEKLKMERRKQNYISFQWNWANVTANNLNNTSHRQNEEYRKNEFIYGLVRYFTSVNLNIILSC